MLLCDFTVLSLTVPQVLFEDQNFSCPSLWREAQLPGKDIERKRKKDANSADTSSRKPGPSRCLNVYAGQEAEASAAGSKPASGLCLHEQAAGFTEPGGSPGVAGKGPERLKGGKAASDTPPRPLSP